MTPKQISRDVATAGTRQQIMSSGFALTGVFQARLNNAGRIFVGLVDVSSTVYMFALDPGDSIPLPPVPSDADGWDMSKFYIDAATSGDGVRGFYGR